MCVVGIGGGWVGSNSSDARHIISSRDTQGHHIQQPSLSTTNAPVRLGGHQTDGYTSTNMLRPTQMDGWTHTHTQQGGGQPDTGLYYYCHATCERVRQQSPIAFDCNCKFSNSISTKQLRAGWIVNKLTANTRARVRFCADTNKNIN